MMGTKLLCWLLRRIFRGQLGRWLLQRERAFYNYLRMANYPPPQIGGAIIIHEFHEDRARFMLAVLWALAKTAGLNEKELKGHAPEGQ